LSQLRNYIVEGNIADGARISERQLCEMLKISRTPCGRPEGSRRRRPGRAVAGRGARVRPLNAHDIRELFDLMGGLEGLAGRLACEHISAEASKKSSNFITICMASTCARTCRAISG